MAVEIFGRPVGQTNKAASRASVFAPYRTGQYTNPPAMGAPFATYGANQDTVQQMGPGEPAQNFPLGGEPRQYRYRVGQNFPTTPDTDRGISGELLRSLADMSWLVRRCIEIRKSELCALDWEIVAQGKTGRDKQKMADKYADLIDEVTDFFKTPDGGYFVQDNNKWVRIGMVDWGDWLNAGLEDHFVGDWWCVWPKRTVSGDDLVSLARIDGEHIKALIDLGGRTPTPPLPAWQQYMYGAPRGYWAADEFYYMPRNVRNQTQYGYSHVQQSLVMINLALKYDQWNSATYNESTLPLGLLEAPQGIAPEQLDHIADFLNGAINTVAERLKIHPVPFGTKWQPIKPFEYSQEYAMYIIEGVCACFDVQPQELGYAPSRAGMGGDGFADGQSETHRRKSLLPTARWIERKITKIINDQWRDKGGSFIEFRFTELVGEDEEAKANANKVAIYSGQKSLDDILEEDGQDGLGIGHIMEIGNSILFLNHGVALTKDGLVPLDFEAVKQQAKQQQEQAQQPPQPQTNVPQPTDVAPEGEIEPSEPQTQKVATVSHDGVMIALYPPADLAKELAVDGGEDPDELHVTLAYLGKTSDIGDEKALKDAVKRAAQSQMPFDGTVGGIGRFSASKTSDGMDVVYASIDAAALPEFRQAIVKAVEDAGSTVRKDHGFTPHMTLSYIPSDSDSPIDRMEPRSIHFSSVWLVIAGKRYEYPFGHGDDNDTKKAAAVTLPPNIALIDPNQPSDETPADYAAVEAATLAKRKSHEIELWFAKEFLKRFRNRKANLEHANTPESIATAYQYTPAEIQELGEMIGKLKIGAYTAGINTAFDLAGYPLIDTLSDPLLKQELMNDAMDVASEIAKTFKADAEKEAERLLDLGVEDVDLSHAMTEWEKQRAEWKAEQIAKSEAANPFVKGTVEAVDRNGWKVAGWEVTPEQCKCARCQELVDSNPWTPEYGVLLALWLPLHPNCIHSVQPIWEQENPPGEPVWKG